MRGATRLWSLLLAVCTAIAIASPAAALEAVFVRPANGSLGVARLPVISLRFDAAIPAAGLDQEIFVLDRLGQPVALQVTRSGEDDHVAIAVPASAEDRPDPAADYFIESRLGAAGPSQYLRTHFRTGGDKSVFCIGRAAREPWGSTCDDGSGLKTRTPRNREVPRG